MVGDRLKSLNLTQNELAKSLGVTQTYVHYLINGKRHPSIELLPRIARCLNVSPYSLFDEYVTELAAQYEHLVEESNAKNN